MSVPSRSRYLSAEEVERVLDVLPRLHPVQVTRIQYKNKTELRTLESMEQDDLRRMIAISIEEGHQYGGDMEIPIPELKTTLVGHHDGLYWLEPDVAV
jgi:hypothetical protein